MQKNVGDTDAYLRITLGLTLLGFGVMDRSRIMVGLGAMKVAEGITHHCPMLHLMHMSTACHDQEMHPDMVCEEDLTTE